MSGLASSWIHARAALRKPAALSFVAVLVALVVALPLLGMALGVILAPSSESWTHLTQTVLPRYAWNSIQLALTVGAGTVLVGGGCAWLVATQAFPGRGLLQWALVLPLAMPAYVIAYAYTDLLQFSGPVQTGLRELSGWRARQYWFPEIRSLGGAAAMFILVLYPYVYLPARAAFAERSASLSEAARLLGLSPMHGFVRVALPLARPALAGGAALAVMEMLADYGAVSYFAVETFTTGVYKAWFGLNDRVAAAQLACTLLGVVLLFLWLERASRGRARYQSRGSSAAVHALQPLHGGRAWLATLCCTLPVVLGFLLPAAVLIALAWREPALPGTERFPLLAANSFGVAALAAAVTVVAALLLAYAQRLHPGPVVRLANRAAGLGYAVPGAVIAVAILIPLARFDNALDAFLQQHFGIRSGLLLTGTVAALVYAYVVRFLALALVNVEAGLSRISHSMEEAARSLGCGLGSTLARVHAPLLSRSLAVAALLVFVDALKELPATLALRPFDFDTLATRAYVLAKDERLAEAALPSLAIVLVGLLPVLLVSRTLGGRKLEP
jgi:iron(III) transport system permease protein